MVEVKNKKDPFYDGFLPMGRDVDVDSIKYKTLDEVPVCIVNGGKEPTDWFIPEADLRHIWLYPPSTEAIEEYADAFHALSKEARKDPLAVKHYKPEEDKKRIEREREERKSGKKKYDSALSTLRDAKTDEDLIRIQAGNRGYQLSKKSELAALGAKDEEQVYELCRSADKNSDGSVPLWTYKKGGHKIFDLQKCQANASAVFAPVEGTKSNADKLHIVSAGNLQTPDYCVADSLWIASSEPAVYRFDNAIAPRILKSKIPHAQEIIEHMKKATASTRHTIELRESGAARAIRAEAKSDKNNLVTHSLIAGSTLASLFGILLATGKIKLGKSILKKIRNISEEAKSGALGKPKHWMGMNNDLKQMAEIMGAPEINSVRTIGPNGSGKSARWEALAVCIEDGHFPDGTPIPDHLKGKRVYELTPKIHIMGDEKSSYLGAAEQFVRKVAEAVSKRGDILHVDEAHGLNNLGVTTASAGSGGAEEGLKPMMARKGKKGKKARLGFSTTEEEYNASLGKNKALHGRTVPVYIAEPTPQETLAIMHNKKDLYEKDAGRKISDGALKAAVELTQSDTDTHYPRKSEKLLGLAYGKAGPGEEVTAQHVTAAAQELVKKALGQATAGAIADRNEAELNLEPEDQIRVLKESVAKIIKGHVEGFEGELNETKTVKMERLIDIVARSWQKAVKEAPMIRSVHKSSSDPIIARYGIPESFTVETLRSCAEKEGIVLRSSPVAVEPKKGGGGPPDGAGGARGPGTPPSEPPPAAPRRGGARAEGRGGRPRVVATPPAERGSSVRGMLDGAGGFAATAGPFIALDVAEHYGVVTPAQKNVGFLGWAGAMTVVNPYTPAELLLMSAPFEMGRIATQATMSRAGVEPQSLTYTVGGTLGGFAGTAAIVKATGGAQVWHQAAASVQNGIASRIGSAGLAVEEGLIDTYQNMRMGVQMYGGQVVDWAKNTAGAGASLFAAARTGVVRYGGATLAAMDAVGAMVTPLIIVGDLSVGGKGEEI